MSEDNLVYEITQMMGDKAAIQNDMSEAMSLVNNMFKEKYINKLHTAVQSHHFNVKNNPPKEAQLLQVLKQFMPKENHAQLDKMIDGFILMNTAQSIRREMVSAGYSNGYEAPKKDVAMVDTSIHPDGIYDIDAACITQSNDSNNVINCDASGGGLALLLTMLMLGR